MGLILPVFAFGLLTASYILYRRLTRISIAHVRGPESKSFLLGNFCELFQKQAGETEFKWQAQYGDIVRLKASFGEDRLLISDPKALQYIHQTSGYGFLKQPERREVSRMITGRGITWADGDDHRRHRKVLLPGFSGPEAKACVPIFSSTAVKLGEKWKEIINASADQSSVFNIHRWASRAALDAIGKAAFDYEFGALDDIDNPLGKAYANLLLNTMGTITAGELFFQNMLAYVPETIREALVDYMPSSKLNHARATTNLANGVAKSLVDLKADALLQGKGNRDIMSLLVKANASENEKMKLNEDELLSQMRTIIIAGHETTATTLSWLLLELSRQPKIQDRLRQEIRSMEQTIESRGGSGFSAADFDAMPYLTAFVKEGLRFFPVVSITFRRAMKDDVLPLSKPITTKTGELINELPIPKGLKILASINGHNRNTELFGEDVHVFDPERWLDSRLTKASSVGVLGNLMTFSGGVRSCLGWKFAVLEIQAFLVELVGTFEFSITPEVQKLRKEFALAMLPTIEGEVEKGSQLPLRVRYASREEIDS